MDKCSLQRVLLALLLMTVAACSSVQPHNGRGDNASAVVPSRAPSIVPSVGSPVSSPVDSPVASPKAGQPAVTRPEVSYVVKKGDTLSSIARRFSVSPLQLQYRNKIANPRNLQIGARLVIADKNLQVPSSFQGNGGRFIWPLRQLDVSSEYGTRHKRHKGIDLRAPRGTAIHAAAEGVVEFVGRIRGYGKIVIIAHAGQIKTSYAHNHKNLVKKGQRVKQGEVIATVGTTGNATGSHLHFEFIRSGKKLNPRHHVSAARAGSTMAKSR